LRGKREILGLIQKGEETRVDFWIGTPRRERREEQKVTRKKETPSSEKKKGGNISL